MRLRRAVGWQGGLVRELSPVGGATLPGIGWLPHAAVAGVAVVLGVVTAGQSSMVLGLAQGLPLAVVGPRGSARVLPVLGYAVTAVLPVETGG